MGRSLKLAWAGSVLGGAIALGVAGPAAIAQPAPQVDASGANGPYSVFADTIADMTWPDVEAQAKGGAVAIWGIAVIEEHGPALPLGTDTYESAASTRLVKADLAAKGIKSLIVPALAWGASDSTSIFPGTLNVRPAVLTELMVDVFKSLHNTGFKTVFVIPGHGDAGHNKAIFDASKRAMAEAGIQAVMITNLALAQRIGLDPKDPVLALTPPGPPPSGPPPKFIETHSGAGEHSTMMAFYPKVVKLDVVPTLKDAEVTPAKLAEWRKGGEITRQITPLGYTGDPSKADAARGRAAALKNAEVVADTIAAKLK
jgi:creatinine amidohydrolase